MSTAGYRHTDEALRKIGDASRAQWQNPEIREKRCEGLRAAWRRRREGPPCCRKCGQVLPGRVVE